MATKGERAERDNQELGLADTNHEYKNDKQQGPTYKEQKLHSIYFNNLYSRKIIW